MKLCAHCRHGQVAAHNPNPWFWEPPPPASPSLPTLPASLSLLTEVADSSSRPHTGSRVGLGQSRCGRSWLLVAEAYTKILFPPSQPVPIPGIFLDIPWSPDSPWGGKYKRFLLTSLGPSYWPLAACSPCFICGR